MSALIELLGKNFSRWTVGQRAPNDKSGRAMWICICECGKQKIVMGKNLIAGNSRSCGCLSVDTARQTKTKHGHRKNRKDTPTYKSYNQMLYRCKNPNCIAFINYGARGITVCERWQGPNGFQKFLVDMGERPSGRSLDRIENNLGYEPGNCRWATPKEQANNRRKARPRKSLEGVS